MHGLEDIWPPRPLLIGDIMKWILIFIGLTNLGMAQNLNKHLWEERVILIFADSTENELADKQVQFFMNQKEALKDRNTALYYCKNNVCDVYFSRHAKQSPRSMHLDTSFKVVLVGLDGDIKYESQQLEAAQVYFGKIDKMYLRKREMQKRIKKKGY